MRKKKTGGRGRRKTKDEGEGLECVSPSFGGMRHFHIIKIRGIPTDQQEFLCKSFLVSFTTTKRHLKEKTDGKLQLHVFYSYSHVIQLHN
jgi:hypothetical protein